MPGLESYFFKKEQVIKEKVEEKVELVDPFSDLGCN